MSLAAILARVSSARRVIESERVSLPGTVHHALDKALDSIEEEARALMGQVAEGIHTNPRRNPVLVVYGNPPEHQVSVKVGDILGYVEQLSYERTARPRGSYFHDFGSGDALVPGTLAAGQRIVLIMNVNGKPLWGTA